jgi:hypothetical protein
MHWYRDGAKQRSKVLYVFRSPSGMRVGRNPLDPDVLREIEREHPDIAFAWDEVRGSQQVVEMSPEAAAATTVRGTRGRSRPRRAGGPRSRGGSALRGPSDGARRRDVRRAGRVPHRVVSAPPRAGTASHRRSRAPRGAPPRSPSA